MKRAGNLFDSVLDMENLRLAFWKASRGKRAREDQRAYAADKVFTKKHFAKKREELRQMANSLVLQVEKGRK